MNEPTRRDGGPVLACEGLTKTFREGGQTLTVLNGCASGRESSLPPSTSTSSTTSTSTTPGESCNTATPSSSTGSDRAATVTTSPG